VQNTFNICRKSGLNEQWQVQRTFNICRKPELNEQWQVQRTGIFTNKLRCAAPAGYGILDVSTNINPEYSGCTFRIDWRLVEF